MAIDTSKKDYNNTMGYLKSIPEDPNSHKDPTKPKIRERVSEEIRNLLWSKCVEHDLFDERYFRQDIFKNVIIRNIKYRADNDNKIFAGEIEHIVHFKDGGSYNGINLCYLNAGINRKRIPLYELNYYEYQGLRAVCGKTFGNLERDLRLELHETCKKYNLLFTFQNNKYSLILLDNGTYQTYNDEYLTKQENAPSEKIISNTKTETSICQYSIDDENISYEKFEAIVIPAIVDICSRISKINVNIQKKIDYIFIGGITLCVGYAGYKIYKYFKNYKKSSTI